MKRFKFIYILLLLVAVFITSCSNDEPTGENNTARKDGKVSVRLRLSQASSTVTTRAEDTPDPNAEAKELMNIWTVVITRKSGEVVDILTCMPADTDREIDEIEETLELATGEYEFYSFANIDALHLAKLLGFAEASATSQSVIPGPPTEKGKIRHAGTTSITNLKFPAEGKTSDSYTANVNGNNFNAFDDTNKDNGFGYYGIPMSNKQTITINEDTEVVDLIVVRMLAKVKLQITNGGADDITIKSVILTDITKYDADAPNLKLFPKYTSTAIPNGSDLMGDYEHGDIQPNLNGAPDTEEVTIEVKDETGKFVSVASGETKEITFYVNESQAPNTSQNLYKHFYLKLNLAKSSTVGGGDETPAEVTEQRYAMIDDSNAEGSTGKWDYIARNDYRIIPISLDDYKFELIPYDFPAIGVYPVSVKEEDGLNTITFHDYGHFHLLPKVTKFTTSGAESVSYGTGNETWSLRGGTFISAWGSWDDHTKTSAANVASFYGAGSFADGDGNANINDGDDAGGTPVWYANDNTKSQWSPDGTNYQPFIFGYIANPGGKLNEDRKVYHEFTIVINKDGSATREMTYRLYMILDTEQMMYGRSRKFAAPSAHHKC